MMKGVSDTGTVFIGLTQEEVGRLLLGEVRAAPVYTTPEGHTAPAVKVFYAPTYEELRVRLQAETSAPLPPIVDLRDRLKDA
jgi:hypothetical protein